MSKHTPGPWNVNGDHINAPLSGNVNGICQMLFTCDPIINEQVKADAKLVAAAPSLLNAACLALSTLKVAIKANWEGATDEDIDDHLVIKILRAAIANAQG